MLLPVHHGLPPHRVLSAGGGTSRGHICDGALFTAATNVGESGPLTQRVDSERFSCRSAELRCCCVENLRYFWNVMGLVLATVGLFLAKSYISNSPQ
eukprot:COSAG01_NODE_2991_length_6744_cov_251.630248_6_plen_97_part_00